MAEPQNTGEKGRRPRPFGSFLLFLTVLIVVLVAFGGSQFRGTRELTQDQFLHHLVSGEVEQLHFKGENRVEGVLAGEERFVTSVADLDESSWREWKARARYRTIKASDLRRAVDEGWFTPEEIWHVVERGDGGTLPAPQGSDAPKAVPQEQQIDRVFTFGTAAAAADWGLEAPPARLPASGGAVAFKVEGVGGGLAGLLAELDPLGTSTRTFAFDLRQDKGTTHGPAASSFYQTLLLWGPLILIVIVFLVFMRQMRSQGTGAGVMSFGRSRAQMYTKENHTGITFEDVAGAQEAKDEVREVVEFLKNPGKFTRIGGRIPRGVLLVGPPGCGKTLLAKAIAGEAEVPFFSISGSDFVEMFVGVGASRVRDLFKQARENSPCIIFLDEIDAVGRRRGSGMGGGHDEREQTLNAILVEMDGFSTDEGIIVVAATNRPDVLDPALLRPGRFDREVTIDLPDLEGREHILRVHLKKVKSAEGVDVRELARATPGYSGADLAAIVNEAAIMAVLDRKERIEMSHLEEASAKVRYGRKKTSRKIEPEDLRITAYHEAGHTIVADRLDGTDVPHKVTIVPRGRALGATMMLPEKESYHTQKKRLIAQLAMLFGGRAAEAHYCGDISAGASDDIRRATELARAMVSELGMSEKVGPINYADRQGSDFLGTELMSSKWHSEETARLIDEEVERVLREAYETADRIVSEDAEAIERLTGGLLLYETLERPEIRRLIDGAEPRELRDKTAREEREEREAERRASPVVQPKRSPEVEGDGELSSGLSPA